MLLFLHQIVLDRACKAQSRQGLDAQFLRGGFPSPITPPSLLLWTAVVASIFLCDSDGDVLESGVSIENPKRNDPELWYS